VCLYPAGIRCLDRKREREREREEKLYNGSIIAGYVSLEFFFLTLNPSVKMNVEEQEIGSSSSRLKVVYFIKISFHSIEFCLKFLEIS